MSGRVVFEGTIVARGTFKQIKGPLESKLMQYLQSEGVFVTVKSFKTIKLKIIGFFYKLSPDFTYRPIFEAVAKDAFEETLNADEEDTGTDVPEFELIMCGPKARRRSARPRPNAWRSDVKRGMPPKSRICMERGEEDGEDDIGRFAPHSFHKQLNLRFSAIRTISFEV
jgi:hypothetical protein